MTTEQWISRYVTEMIRFGIDMQFATECAEASLENKEDDILTPEAMVHEDISCWSD